MPNDSGVVVEFAKNSDPGAESIVHNLGGVVFWGAQTYMYVNIIHFLACILVVVIYCTLPVVNKNLYNRVVLRHNLSLLIVGGMMLVLGFCQLSNCPFNDTVIRLLWLNLQYFTNATVFWLNVICFDMTLMITRFCWIRTTENRADEERKLTIYSALVWGGAMLPTAMAAIFEFLPQIPRDFSLRANYTEATHGPRPVVNMYFFLVPACTLLCNNLLFVVTTYKIVRIQRSTQLVVQDQENLLKKKYFLFLRLYLFMGAPWFFGSVLACINKLFVLKVCRMAQPVLWLVMLVSRKKIRQQLTKKFRWKKSGEVNVTRSIEAVNAGFSFKDSSTSVIQLKY